MRASKVHATLLLLLLAIEALDANRRKQKEKIPPTTTNICDISDRDSKVHCYCEFNQEINEAVKTECWVFNGGIEKTDSLWPSFISQTNIENLAFNVRADGGLSFVPSKVFKYLRKLKQFSIKYSSIPTIESYAFANVTSVQEMTLTKNQIMHLSRHSFYNIPNLTVLTLDENKIVELVTETFYELPALQKLYLTSNNISAIQDGAFKHLVNLIELELDRNNISELKKECFDGLANLKRLDLRRNKLGVLNSFIFTELWNLQSLLLDYNEIYGLAQRTFDGLSQLRKLSLSHNKLVTLAGGLFEGVRGLAALDLRHNKLKRFTFDNLRPIYDNLKTANSYIYLEDLRRNKLGVLNSFIFTELWNLQSLLLDYNEIYGLAQRTFDGLSQLRKLSLSHNKLVTLAGGLFEGVRGLAALDLRHNKLKRFTFDNLRPIYDNLKTANSYIYLEGNEFPCDCHLAWMHKLRHEARSVKVRTSLENFICKFDAKQPLNSHFTYYERSVIGSNNLYEADDRSQIKDYSEAEDFIHEESDDVYDEPKSSKGENDRTLLQIPVETLPCPQDTKSVTDRTYTYPSQNEAKDYRNLILSSSAKADVHFDLFLLPFMIIISRTTQM